MANELACKKTSFGESFAPLVGPKSELNLRGVGKVRFQSATLIGARELAFKLLTSGFVISRMPCTRILKSQCVVTLHGQGPVLVACVAGNLVGGRGLR